MSVRLAALLGMGAVLGGCHVTEPKAEPRAYAAPPEVRFRPIEGAEAFVAPSVRLRAAYVLAAEGTAHFVAGLSDLIVQRQAAGLRLEAISDYGNFAAFDLTPDTGAPLEMGPLTDAAGQAFGNNKTLSDAEDMAYEAQSGTYYVSFEGHHRVMRYARGLEGAGEVLPLSGLPNFPANQGLEALTVQGQSLILGAESGGFWRCDLEAYVCGQLKGPTTPGMGYALVSLAPLEGATDLLALYRYFTPWTGPRTVLRRLGVDDRHLWLKATILTVRPPLPYDNYEGVAAVKSDDGYELYLLSDPIGDDKPTRLLVFDWTPEAAVGH